MKADIHDLLSELETSDNRNFSSLWQLIVEGKLLNKTAYSKYKSDLLLPKMSQRDMNFYYATYNRDFLNTWAKLTMPENAENHCQSFPTLLGIHGLPDVWFFVLWANVKFLSRSAKQSISKSIFSKRVCPYALLKVIANRNNQSLGSQLWNVYFGVTREIDGKSFIKFLILLTNENLLEIVFDYLYSLSFLDKDLLRDEVVGFHFGGEKALLEKFKMASK